MIPYEIESSLHPGEPLLETLDDGFSPPILEEGLAKAPQDRVDPPVEPGWDQPSPF
jgi:hypothetical protein